MVSPDNSSTAFNNKTNKDLRWAKFLFLSISNPFFMSIGKLLFRFPLAWFYKKAFYKQFVGSATFEGVEVVAESLAGNGIKSILDYSFENGSSKKSYDEAYNEILKTVKYSSTSPHIAFSVFKLSALISPKILSAKISGELLKKEEEDQYNLVLSRVLSLCQVAFDAQKPILIDAEFSWYQDAIDQIAEEMMKKFNKDRAIVYNSIQLYRTDRLQYLFNAHKRALDNDYILGVKLVRGAYMDIERSVAEKKALPSPIHECKPDTDKDYNEALKYAVMNIETISLVCATHNEESLNFLTCLMDSDGIAPNDLRVYFSQLYGMSDSFSFSFASRGYNVAKYIPYGPIKISIPYLIRRIEENTSLEEKTGRELRFINEELKRRRKEKVKN